MHRCTEEVVVVVVVAVAVAVAAAVVVVVVVVVWRYKIHGNSPSILTQSNVPSENRRPCVKTDQPFSQFMKGICYNGWLT